LSFSLLDRPIQFLKGVGPKRAAAFARAGVRTARDLLYLVPRRYDDASTVHPITSLEVGMEATAIGRIRNKGIIPTRAGLRIFQAVLQDETGMITCAWPGQPWMDKKLDVGDLVLVTGPVKFFHGRQIQPRESTVLGRAGDVEVDETVEGRIFATYPASQELPQWVLRGIFDTQLDEMLKRVGSEDPLSASTRKTLELTGLADALERMHRPTSLEDVEVGRKRLAFDELFYLQLIQAMARHRRAFERPGQRFERTNELIRPVHEQLPFELTGAQSRALREIVDDMTGPGRMNRMLQGDVGSGKTVVALFALLLAAENNLQAALMAPTEILAEQHARTLTALLAPVGIEPVLLTGRLSTAEKREVTEAIASGEALIAIGTHALIQSSVTFDRLGLVIVDEQHRFGVKQRMALTERGENPDTLVMSATPIPRTLAMALHGDLDISVLDELPAGRKPVKTLLRFPSKRREVYDMVRRELAAGRQAYVVFPLVEESEKVDLRSATEAHAQFESMFGEWSVGLLHGKMGADEKYEAMTGFLSGEIHLLVCTTVIEVGIDVPNATAMIVEHAERFGLSQLHQLRGRVGRGSADSICVLIAEPGERAMDRLTALRDLHDGFQVAATDLKLRGEGDLFGAQQHGQADVLRFADLSRDEALLAEAQLRAREIIDLDPHLDAPANATFKASIEARYHDRLEMYEAG
jgi:ATP-dependent DNA helicase RecG